MTHNRMLISTVNQLCFFFLVCYVGGEYRVSFRNWLIHINSAWSMFESSGFSCRL